MRIGIDANPMVGDRGGVGWHTYHLLRTMLGLMEPVEFVGYLRPGSIKPDSVGSWPGAERLQWREAGKWGMRWRGRFDRLDLYHGTNFKLHTTGQHGGVVTIHDLWLDRHPEYSKKLFGQRASFSRTKRTAWAARAVITVSEFSANELMELYGLPRERIRVIPNGVSEDFTPRRDDQAMAKLRQRLGLAAERYVLFVGGADPRKNHRLFLEAAAQQRTRLGARALVLVGSLTHPSGSYEESARMFGLTDRVFCPGRLSMRDLRLLYSYADLFVFPSVYEGFGMPVLEAMACGVPVVTSNTTALAEVAADAALLINPHDARAMGEAMVRVLSDAGLRESLRQKGFGRVQQFTWERAARQTLAVYREVCMQGER